MDRHMLSLRYQRAVEIADRRRKIAARIEDLRIGGAKHRFAHLFDDRQQAMLDDRGDDRVDRDGHEFTPARRRGMESRTRTAWRGPETIAARAGSARPPQSFPRPGYRYQDSRSCALP